MERERGRPQVIGLGCDAGLAGQVTGLIPLLIPAIALGIGVYAQESLCIEGWQWPLLVLGAGSLSALVASRAGAAPSASVLVLAAGAFLGLGIARSMEAARTGPHDVASICTEGPRLVTLRGLVWTDPVIRDAEWSFSDLHPFAPPACLDLEVRQVLTIEGLRPCRGLIRVWVSDWGNVADLRAGQEVQVIGHLARPAGPTNPGQFDLAEHLRTYQVRAVMRVKSQAGVQVLGRSCVRWSVYWVGEARRAVVGALRRAWDGHGPERSFVEALVLGLRWGVDSRTYQSFRQTGLIHYLSLSGMHFGIVVATAWGIAGLAGLLRPARALICILVAGMFLLLVPATGPTLRAAIISWVYCGAVVARRRARGPNSLALAALILLVWRPQYLFDPGWQLSFGCLTGIFLVAEPLQARLGSLLAARYTGGTAAGWVVRSAGALLAVGIGAAAGSAGIVLYHFHRFNPMSIVWTCLTFPIIWLVMVLGLIKVLGSMVVPVLAGPLAWLLEGLTGGLLWMVELMARVDLVTIRSGAIGVGPVIWYYAALGLVTLRHWRRPVWRAAFVGLSACGICAWICLGLRDRLGGPVLRLTCLDVGHGQAVVVQGPGRHCILVDGGSLYKRDVGSRVIVPYLDWLGLSRLDAVVASHLDIDHVNGLPEVIRAVDTRAVYAQLDGGPAARILADEIGCQGLTSRPIGELAMQGADGLDVAVLWPLPGQGLQGLSDNDRSAVILLRAAGRQILICSDIEYYAQDRLLQAYRGLKADILVLPHHGSAKTMYPGLIDGLDPQVILCSCTAADAQQVLSLPGVAGREVYCTGLDGAVTVRVWPGGQILVQTHTTRGSNDEVGP